MRQHWRIVGAIRKDDWHDERTKKHNPTKRLVGCIRGTSESRRLDARGLARRSRQEAIATEGGEEADGTTASKPPTEGERLDTGNDSIVRVRKEKVSMSENVQVGLRTNQLFPVLLCRKDFSENVCRISCNGR